jgi:ferric-dicitrate binding protein FerR (iron transport regulator)
VLPGDVITTQWDGSAWVRFRSPASTVLLTDTQVTLMASDAAPTFLLRHGTVVVDEKVLEPIHVGVPGGFVVVKGDPQSGGECQVAALGDGTTVSVKRGLAEIHGQGVPVILHTGESARIDAGPQGSEQVAGKISRVIPQGEIQREGQPQQLPLRINEVVNWNDLVQTLQVGRAQIMLLDGSTLNVGARSSIRVLKHDPQAQQTQLEMTVGKVRADVQKITAPGGKFELTTKSAVIGTIDTSFVADSDDHQTRVCGVDGTTQVKSSDPNITKTVRLHKNECTVVPFGGPPSDPIFAPGELAGLLSATAINVGGGLGTTGTVALAAGLAAGAGAAIAGIVLATSGATSPTVPTP